MLTLKGKLGIEDFYQIIFKEEPILINKDVLATVENSFNFLSQFSQNKIIYGVNTGFGPMAQYKINDSDRIQLQYNLIRSHASGTGNLIPAKYVKAAMLARLNTLSLGHSGVHISVIQLMTSLINKNITPVIFEHGGVGASGDLVQLAHIALVLIGEGEVFYKGERRATEEVFKIENLKPITIALREGLGLINGTSVMTGIGLINTINTRKLLDWMICCSSAINEIVEAYDDHLSLELNRSKKHKGQQQIAKSMRNHLKDSALIRKREHHLYNGNSEVSIFEEKFRNIIP
jgi:histidine ammonia-lyase